MTIRPFLFSVLTLAAAGLTLALAGVAAADHTHPDDPQSQPTEGQTQAGDARGEGEWEHLFNAPPNPGSDHHYFTKSGEVYVAHGTIGQDAAQHVGQRFFRLMDADGEFDPEAVEWVADHGSAACTHPDPGATLGLQHDQWTTPVGDPELLFDSTDAADRCHDEPSGGIEIIDISGLGEEDFEVRELHLVRFASTTHTLTVDDAFPWIVWSNNSAPGAYWMDFMDVRSCLSEAAGGTVPADATLEEKREQCRPEVYRIPLELEWTQRTVTLDGEPQGPGNGCHDVTSVGTTVHCSAVDSDVIIDIAGMVGEDGSIQGTRLPCEVIEAEPRPDAETGAMVTDCQLGGTHPTAAEEWEAWEAADSPQATGWQHLGHYNHPGREDNNNNFSVPADQGIAISHQTAPLQLPDEFGQFMVVSDERGGGVLPHGAACGDDEEQEFWHSGLHFFDITDPADIQYATMLDEDGEERRAFWRGEVLQPMPTFCVVHVFHPVPDEQRLFMGYYSQGIKILDYRMTDEGHFEFDEIAAFRFPGPVSSNTWTANVFHIEDNDDGTRTYFIGVSDIQRGFDILRWTGPPHPVQDPPGVAPPADIDRVAGPGRIETAVEVSQRGFDSTMTVVLAREDDYADALAGAPLAATEDAPTLLTFSHRLPEATEEEIDRLGARRAILLGGEAAISEDVADELREKLILVERIGGANRFETAALVADELPARERAFVAEGEHVRDDRGWPDALSAGPYAAFSEEPVLLVNRDRLPEETAQALADRDVTETLVVGGSGAVSDAVVAQIDEAGHGPRRLFGADRYGTSAAVLAEALEAGMSVDTTWLATGLNWPDALTAGAVAGGAGEALLLVHGRTLDNSPATRDALEERIDDVSLVRLLGGTDAISSQAEGEVADLLEQRAPADDGDSGGTTATALLGLLIVPAVALLRRARR